ncbi:AraC family transcriptional regulator [Paenibacillus sp. LHD-38]|uniref:AraC family transcriptional regulator n=1 Tax=Paenibacillus sp. LHD-38 TaxID=3072143 RepID=UPI00280FCD7B|nr:AraC family transcriptional regulator [Paenibacillus sp. LHD-38]MDQ8738792.1 AraC family transcriptional regulator [Paenibacillus sp. LHD-38]
MNRLMSVDLHNGPVTNLLREAEPGYKGFFHYHPGIELLYVHEGEGSVILNQTVYPMNPGTLFLFQPYQLHYVRAITESSSYVRSIVHFEPNTFASGLHTFGSLSTALRRIWKERLASQAFYNFADRHPIEPLLRYYERLLNQATPEGRTSLKAALLTQMLIFLESEGTYQLDKAPSSSRSASHAEAILEWIENHFHEPFKLEQLASDLHLSKFHVSRLFREETGQTVTDYLLARRIKEACLLLTTKDWPVETIGARVGWPIPSHFSSQFRKWAGCTPTQYRSKQQRLLTAVRAEEEDNH